MKVALLGGGGFRTPLSYSALEGIAARVPISEMVLHDVAGDRLERMQRVLDGLRIEGGHGIPVRATMDLDDAVSDAAFVLCAIRVGGLEGRLVDETVPRAAGVLGQETVGPGGIAFALRTVPAMLDIAETVVRRAPRAWFINFTNPVGITTEALQPVLGERAIGVCDTPSALCRRVARLLGRRPQDVWFDYFGLNHLGWLRGVIDASGDRLPGLLDNTRLLGDLEETALFGAARLRSLGMIPNEYLYYYDTSHPPGHGRAEYLLEQQRAFYATPCDSPAEHLDAWRAASAERDRTYMADARGSAAVAAAQPSLGYADARGSAAVAAAQPSLGYADVAAALLEALACNTRSVLILNVANRSSLGCLDPEAVVEMPCIVGSNGAVPVATRAAPPFAQEVLQTIKCVERLTIEAAVSGSSNLAIQALAKHPLVPSATIAERIFDAYRAAHPALQARF